VRRTQVVPEHQCRGVSCAARYHSLVLIGIVIATLGAVMGASIVGACWVANHHRATRRAIRAWAYKQAWDAQAAQLADEARRSTVDRPRHRAMRFAG